MKSLNQICFVVLMTLLLCDRTMACPNKDTLCGSCVGSTCVYCYAGYIGKDGVCKMPPTPIDNCLTYSNDQTCSMCVFGYSLQNNACKSISVEKCVRTTKQGSQCLVCEKGILAVDGVCKSENKCSIDNCRYCAKEEGVELCIMCDAGHSILATENGVVCNKDKEESFNCLAVDQNDKSRCSLCKAGFYASNEKCVESEDYEINQESAVLLSMVSLIIALFV